MLTEYYLLFPENCHLKNRTPMGYCTYGVCRRLVRLWEGGDSNPLLGAEISVFLHESSALKFTDQIISVAQAGVTG